MFFDVIKFNFSIVVEQIPQFKDQSKHVQWHIQHQYSKEMSSKSTVVS